MKIEVNVNIKIMKAIIDYKKENSELTVANIVNEYAGKTLP